MADKRISPTDTYEQAIQIREAWTNIDPANTYGDMKLADLAASITALDTVEVKIRQLEDQLAAARDEHKDTRYGLWDKVKRARSGAKAKHGDNSGEYERFGGTRISERQRRTPTPDAPVVL